MKYRIAYATMLVSMLLAVFGPIYSAHYRMAAILAISQMATDPNWKPAGIDEIKVRMNEMTHIQDVANRGLYATAAGALMFALSTIACFTFTRQEMAAIRK